MPRLPIPGSDDNVWGSVLNDFLNQVHDSQGQLKANTVGTSQIQDNAITSDQLDTGAITKADVGLGNVDNTSDANKPVSTATQTGLNAKEPTITSGTSAQYFRGDKSWQTLDKAAVGLANADDTSDANKPISTAAQAALDLKADTADLGAKVLLIDDAPSLPAGTPAGVIVVVKS
jgi:hypothetical protein